MLETNIIELGKVGITVEKSPWKASTFYERLTMVHHKESGNTYVSVEDNVNRDPSKDDGSNWILASMNGMSIYELMVARGKYSGTEEQFLADYNKAVADAKAAAATATTATTAALAAADEANEAKVQAAAATELCENATTAATAATTAANTAAANAASIKTALDNFIEQGGGATDAQVIKNTEEISQLALKLGEPVDISDKFVVNSTRKSLRLDSNDSTKIVIYEQETSDLFVISNPISIEEGTTIEIKTSSPTYGTRIPIAEVLDDVTYGFLATSTTTSFSYVAPRDMTIIVGVRSPYEVKITSSGNGLIQEIQNKADKGIVDAMLGKVNNAYEQVKKEETDRSAELSGMLFNGSILKDGTTDENSTYKRTLPFHVNQGDVIDLSGSAAFTTARMCVAKYVDDTYINILPQAGSVTSWHFEATEDMDIAICVRPTSGYSLTWKSYDFGSLQKKVNELSAKIGNTESNDNRTEEVADTRFVELKSVKWKNGSLSSEGLEVSKSGSSVTDFVYVGNSACVKIVGSGHSVYTYNGNKEFITNVGEIEYSDIPSVKSDVRYIRVVAPSDDIIIYSQPLTALLNNRRLLSNSNITCAAHQGIALGAGSANNLLSSFWGAYKCGFDMFVANTRWTIDDVPVCEHEATITDSIDRTISLSISESTYEQVRTINRNPEGEKTPSLESVVKLAKMCGTKLWLVNMSSTSTGMTQARFEIVWNILAKYRMINNTIMMTDVVNANNILAKNPKMSIAICQSTIASADYSYVTEVFNNAKQLAENYTDATIYMWLNNSHDIQHFVDAAALTAEYPNIKIGMYHNNTSMTNEDIIARLPYLDLYSHHNRSFGGMIRLVEKSLADEYPEIVARAYGKIL